MSLLIPPPWENQAQRVSPDLNRALGIPLPRWASTSTVSSTAAPKKRRRKSRPHPIDVNVIVAEPAVVREEPQPPVQEQQEAILVVPQPPPMEQQEAITTHDSGIESGGEGFRQGSDKSQSESDKRGKLTKIKAIRNMLPSILGFAGKPDKGTTASTTLLPESPLPDAADVLKEINSIDAVRQRALIDGLTPIKVADFITSRASYSKIDGDYLKYILTLARNCCDSAKIQDPTEAMNLSMEGVRIHLDRMAKHNTVLTAQQIAAYNARNENLSGIAYKRRWFFFRRKVVLEKNFR